MRTGDKFDTLFSERYKTSYHSLNGAFTEAQHIYVKNGFLKCTKQDVKILEVGYGTGLNAMATYKETKNHDKNVIYHAVELFPLTCKKYDELNYQKLLGFNNYEMNAFCNDWETELFVTDEFALLKMKIDINDFIPKTNYDIIYYDAFSSDVQAEMWTEEIFEKIYNCLNNGGRLLTYSASGVVKRALRAVGFVVKRLEGPPGKRHIVEASKII